MALVGAISVPVVLFPRVILSVFIHDPATLDIADLPLRVFAASLFFDSVGVVLMNALMGVGDTRRVMVISTSYQWLLFLPMVYVVGPVMGLGLVLVFVAQVTYRCLQSVTFALMWKRGRWQTIELH
jgi:Na+-driven multidrug efflux pump